MKKWKKELLYILRKRNIRSTTFSYLPATNSSSLYPHSQTATWLTKHFSQLPTYISRGLSKTRSLQLGKKDSQDLYTSSNLIHIQYRSRFRREMAFLCVCPSVELQSISFPLLFLFISSFSYLPLCICPLVFSLFLLLSSSFSFPPSVHLFLFLLLFLLSSSSFFQLVLFPLSFFFTIVKTLFSFSSSFLLH